MALAVFSFQMGTKYFVEGAVDDDLAYEFEGKKYKSTKVKTFDRGQIVVYGSNEAVCDSYVLIFPGSPLLPAGFLAVFYGLTLVYLFMGIDIISEIFMSAIEKITSKQEILSITNDRGDVIAKQKINYWNPTVANLTLMALGSSAPEILLAVIETVSGLGSCPGELGASTIVGSAAFNLLIISALSIIAVNKENDTDPDRDMTTPDGVKKINDMGVFTITATWSVIAYIWLYVVLLDQNVTSAEAWITLTFFFLLIGMAYAADRYNQSKQNKEEESNKLVVEFSAIEIYKELINEKKGEHAENDA